MDISNWCAVARITLLSNMNRLKPSKTKLTAFSGDMRPGYK